MLLEFLLFWGFAGSFLAWLVAVFHRSRVWCLVFGIAAIVTAASLTPSFSIRDLSNYRTALALINRALETGDMAGVRRAIQVHDETYEATDSYKAAAWSLIQTLQEQHNTPSRNAAHTPSNGQPQGSRTADQPGG